MSDYQALARKYRPQTFREILGQDSIVTTLKNAIKRNRTAHAYLFCGARGTGKTTLARVFAKVLNCQNPQDGEPCNQCSSCREISAGHSLDIIEIDGASHRGIDDMRQINETVGYAASSGKFKVYIIDEVHMLTKEAFNALLKTLEEPPPKVKFFFATTEPHKVLPTILSRCQRFNLSRISILAIMGKLQQIANDLHIKIEEGALRLLAGCADGGLRDAESLFDQIIAFHDGEMTEASVADVLGMMQKEAFFSLDKAGKEGNLAAAFSIAHQVFSQGKDVSHFLDNLTEHFRNILVVKLCGKSAPFLMLSDQEREQYEVSAKFYTQEQCTTILEGLLEIQAQRTFPHGKIALEGVLLRILRTHQRVPVDYLVRRLVELEQRLCEAPVPMKQEVIAPAATEIPVKIESNSSISEDPSPALSDLPRLSHKNPPPAEPIVKKEPPLKRAVSEKKEAGSEKQKIQVDVIPHESTLPINAGIKKPTVQQQSRHDTLLQFAAVELEGTIRKSKNV